MTKLGIQVKVIQLNRTNHGHKSYYRLFKERKADINKNADNFFNPGTEDMQRTEDAVASVSKMFFFHRENGSELHTDSQGFDKKTTYIIFCLSYQPIMS